jgi:hypothetical protein
MGHHRFVDDEGTCRTSSRGRSHTSIIPGGVAPLGGWMSFHSDILEIRSSDIRIHVLPLSLQYVR